MFLYFGEACGVCIVCVRLIRLRFALLFCYKEDKLVRVSEHISC
jgi:hypothetical protein